MLELVATEPIYWLSLEHSFYTPALELPHRRPRHPGWGDPDSRHRTRWLTDGLGMVSPPRSLALLLRDRLGSEGVSPFLGHLDAVAE
jgi:hypothetical protein